MDTSLYLVRKMLKNPAQGFLAESLYPFAFPCLLKRHSGRVKPKKGAFAHHSCGTAEGFHFASLASRTFNDELHLFYHKAPEEINAAKAIFSSSRPGALCYHSGGG
jgi:hypothetical protein